VTVAIPTHAGREVVRFVKAQVSTGAATLAEWACVWLLTAGGVYYVLAAIGGAGVGAVLDFSIKRFWVFEGVTRSVASEGLRYALVSGLSALLFGGSVYVCVDLLHLRMPVAVVAGSVFVGIFWNYPLHRFFVFTASRNAGTPS
jgi:putative flippase GtrA